MSEHYSAQPSLIRTLEQRGLVFQKTAEEALDEHLQEPRAVYCGFDPSGDSLHVGSLLQLVNLRRWQEAGHTPIILIGGATGMIGDPSFKSLERGLLTDEQVQRNVQGLLKQVQLFVDFSDKPNGAKVVNNHDWISRIDIIEFLRDVGKHFSVNTMINRESVKQRLGREGAGLSFTEFTYTLLQGLDFNHLYQEFGCSVQLGGSDQWGNIVSGIDYTRRKSGVQVFGVTLPLIVKADGTKFGKTESGAVWLDSAKTSPYVFYQFWMNVADVDVYRFLRQFTFLSLQEIQQIEAFDSTSNQKPTAQKRLAREVTQIVHGEDGVVAAERIAHALFGGDVTDLSATELEQLQLDGLPSFKVSADISLVEALTTSGLAQSRRAAREFIGNKAIRINSASFVGTDDATLASDQFMHDRFLVLQRGRKAHALLVMS